MVLQINHPGPGSLGVIQKGLEGARWGLYRTKARLSQPTPSLVDTSCAEHSTGRGATADTALCPFPQQLGKQR